MGLPGLMTSASLYYAYCEKMQGYFLLFKAACAAVNAVINQLHVTLENMGQPGFDTVRGTFAEGEPPYPGAGFQSLTHTQIAVCTPQAIKGYFRVQPHLYGPQGLGTETGRAAPL